MSVIGQIGIGLKSGAVAMGFAIRVRSAGQKYGPTYHQRDRADVTEFVTLVRLSLLGQHVGVLELAGYKRRKSALTANPIPPRRSECNRRFAFCSSKATEVGSMMCDVMPTISEDGSNDRDSTYSGDDANFEQLMVNMLEERDKVVETLRETQDSLAMTQAKLSDAERDRDALKSQLTNDHGSGSQVSLVSSTGLHSLLRLAFLSNGLVLHTQCCAVVYAMVWRFIHSAVP